MGRRIIRGKSGGYEETLGVTGATTSSYVTALDINMRGKESGVGTIANTSATQTMVYKVLGEFADYSEGELNEIVAEQTLTVSGGATPKDRFNLEHAYARILVQVKNGDGIAAYSIDALSNKT